MDRPTIKSGVEVRPDTRILSTKHCSDSRVRRDTAQNSIIRASNGPSSNTSPSFLEFESRVFALEAWLGRSFLLAPFKHQPPRLSTSQSNPAAWRPALDDKFLSAPRLHFYFFLPSSSILPYRQEPKPEPLSFEHQPSPITRQAPMANDQAEAAHSVSLRHSPFRRRT